MSSFRNALGRLLRNRLFPGTRDYWEQRYVDGGTSGSGSYGRLAEFKAEFVNEFVRREQVLSVIEYGCGDGNQLALARYPRYLGLDVSPAAVRRCAQRFAADRSKSFVAYDPQAWADPAGFVRADLALSLDVLYHLVEDSGFENYLHTLFAAAGRFVIIYASDFDAPPNVHEHRRCFTRWVGANLPGWRLRERVPNRYPYSAADPENTSLSDFYVYERAVAAAA